MCSLPLQGDPGHEGDPGLTVRTSNHCFLTGISTETHREFGGYNDKIFSASCRNVMS